MLGFLAQTTSDFTYTTTQVDTGETVAFLGVGLGIIFVTFLIFYLLTAFIASFIFKKAGRPMWAAYVPIYSSWVLFEIAGKPGWWVLVNFIPFVGSVIYFVLWIVAALELAKRFGRSALFAVLGLIVFPFIGFIMLAFGKSQYLKTEGGQGNNDFMPPTTPDTPLAPVQPGMGQVPASPQVPPVPPQQPVVNATPDAEPAQTPQQSVVMQPPVQPQSAINNPQDPSQTPPAAPGV